MPEQNNDKQPSEQSFSNYKELSLLKNRTIFLSEAVTSDTAKEVVTSLLTLDSQSKDPIYLYVNSPGGEVNSGFAIYDTIRFIESKVYVVTAGLCASIATIINIAVPAEHRLSLPNSRFLIHQPLISGQVYGQASDLEITANEIIKTRQKINELLSKECGQELKKVTEDTKRDYWMSAEEAVQYGLINKIISSKTELGA